MKALLFQAAEFAFGDDPATLPPAAGPLILALIHAEPGDREASARVLRKTAKQVKWLANKRGLKQIVLHSFAHLGEAKAPPEDAEGLIEALAARLSAGGYDVGTTPFGESLAWRLSVFQEPLAKVFVSVRSRPAAGPD